MATLHSTGIFVSEDFSVSAAPRRSRLLSARVALVVTLLAYPWAFGAVDAWASMSMGLCLCIAVLLWAAGGALRRELRLAWSPLLLPVAGFLLLGLAQYFLGFSAGKGETRQALVQFAVPAVAFFLSLQLFPESDSESRRWFGLTVLLLAGGLGLFAILQFASATPRMYWLFETPGIFFGPYSNPDHYAGLMEMLCPVAVCWIVSQRAHYSSGALLLMVAAASVAVASLLLTGSRGGLLALSTEIAIAGVMFRGRAKRANRWSLTAVLVGSVLAVLLLFSWVDPGWVARRLGTVIDVQGQTWVEASDFRRRVAVDSLRMLRDHPVLGVGLGNFEIAYPRYQSFSSDLTIDYAHNDYVQAAAETGLIGAALIIFGLAVFLSSTFRNGRGAAKFGHGWIQFGAALGCCGLLLHSLVDFNLHIPANAAWFAVLAGMAVTRR